MIQMYSTSLKDKKLLAEAKSMLEDAKSKIEYIRMMMMRVKQQQQSIEEQQQQTANDQTNNENNGNDQDKSPQQNLKKNFTKLPEIISPLELRIEELRHRLKVEVAMVSGK